MIDFTRARFLVVHLPVIARQEQAVILEMGIVANHIHLLMRLHPVSQIPRLLQRMKGGTAHGINRGTASRAGDLRWAKGYSLVSVSPRNRETAAAYIRNQHIRHPDQCIPGWSHRPLDVASAPSTLRQL